MQRLTTALVIVALVVAAGCSSSGSKGAVRPATSATSRASSTVNTTTTTTRAPSVSAQAAPFVLPGVRSGAAAVAQGGDVFLMGGQDAAKSSTNTVWKIDVKDGTVAPDGTLMKALHDAGAAVLRNTIFVMGGGAGSQYDTVQRVTPGGAAMSVGVLPGPRSDVSVAAAGDSAYVVGGYDGAKDLGDVLVTTDGTTYRSLAELAVPVRYGAVGVVGRTLWVVGGLRGNNDVRAVQRIDLDSGTVSEAAALPFTLAHATGFVVNGVLYVAGGRQNSQPSDQLYKLDPSTGALVAVTKLPYAVLDAAAATVGPATYLLGGRRDANINQVAVITVQ